MEKWPRYEVANEDTIFALGVVSINYARASNERTYGCLVLSRTWLRNRLSFFLLEPMHQNESR